LSGLTVSAKEKLMFEDIHGYKVEILEETNTYQKVKFTNLETNKEEYLEWKKNGGKSIYIATFDGKEHIIEKKKDKVYMDNKAIKSEDIETEKYTKSSNAASEWIKMATSKKSSSTDVNSVTATAAILASFYGGPITSLIVTMASYCFRKDYNCLLFDYSIHAFHYRLFSKG